MTETGDDFLQHLLDIFAGEACTLFDQIEAGLAALEQAAGPPRPGLLEPLQDALHTLKGAARSVELGDLEAVCYAFEGVLAGAAGLGAALDPQQLGRLRRALGIARLLVGRPSGRTRNQALAAIGELELLAAQLDPAPASAPGKRVGAIH